MGGGGFSKSILKLFNMMFFLKRLYKICENFHFFLFTKTINLTVLIVSSFL